ncbi:MAG: thiamine pyrophosphate-dependent enzyme [Candidatus Binatia bacterium]
MVGTDAIVTSDVGQHQMWAAQAFPFSFAPVADVRRARHHGLGLPAAIGAALAQPHRTVVCFTGDGSLLMNVQELATAAEEGTNVKIVLLNNGHLGMVRQQQQLFYGARYHASRFHAEPDFAAIARGFGIAAHDLGAAGEIDTSCRWRARCAAPARVSSTCRSLPRRTSIRWCRPAAPAAS